MIGKVLKKHGGFYVVATPEGLYECKLSGKQKHHQRQYIACGDRVNFDPSPDEPGQGYITAVEPRDNFIPRPGIANVDQILIVAAIKEPSYDLFLLDKLIALARYYHIPPSLCFSKMDLASEAEEQAVADYYRQAGLALLFIGAETDLDAVRAICAGRTTVLTGNSGVGKSSLINRLLGREVQAVQDISMRLNRGKNTTRTAEFFACEGGFIVDTPGFSALDFPLEMAKTDLRGLYPEYVAVADGCRFHNCVHINEPDCAVKSRVETAALTPARYDNYKKLFQELETRERMRK